MRIGSSKYIFFLTVIAMTGAITSCSVQRKIGKSAKEIVLSAPSLQNALVGISIYEPATNKQWYSYQGDHFFVPASNTKLATCYAAMKYLGDSLVGLRYADGENPNLNEFIIQPTGDPSFLHPDYARQPVFDFLKKQIQQREKMPRFLINESFIDRWGNGWSWNDFESSDMAERNQFPVFGNVIHVKLTASNNRNKYLYQTGSHYFDSLVNQRIEDVDRKVATPAIELSREIDANIFSTNNSKSNFSATTIPFVTHGLTTVMDVLSDTLHTNLDDLSYIRKDKNGYKQYCIDCDTAGFTISKWHTIHSQPTDSILKPMMHRSDNFFAEQILLMVSDAKLGVMSDEMITDTLLKTDFKDLPQPPRWVDGCGLSRYNLFSPDDLVMILHKIKDEFGMDRIKNILATGGEGTISNYYKTERGFIFAKTGTLSGVVALSGYLYTKKGKELIFSVIVNNHHATATEVRRAVEKFIVKLRNRY